MGLRAYRLAMGEFPRWAEEVWVINPSFVAAVGLAIFFMVLSLLWWRARDSAKVPGRKARKRDVRDKESQTCAEVSLAKILLVEDLRRSGLDKLLRATGRRGPRQLKFLSVEEVEKLLEEKKMELVMRLL